MMITEKKETHFRKWLQWRYEHLNSQREKAIQAAREAEARERQRIAAEARALRELRESLMSSAIDGIMKADHIRSLVKTMDERLGAADADEEVLARWHAWALHKPDDLDIRMQASSDLQS